MSRVERIGNATLYLGDCREILPTLPKVDAVITDPPYGMGWDTNLTRFTGGSSESAKSRGAGGRDYGDPITGDDDEPFDPAMWLEFERVVLFGANHFCQRLPVGTTLIWVKRKPEAFGTFLSDAEIAWMKGDHGVYCHEAFPQGMAHDRHHPTQKPVSLMRWCMERAKVPDGGVVLDPYMGSASTGIAALDAGYSFVGVEIEQRYFDIACRRIDDAQRQGRLIA